MITVILKYKSPLSQKKAEEMLLAINGRIKALYGEGSCIPDIQRFNYRELDQVSFYVEVNLVNHHPQDAQLQLEDITKIVQQHAGNARFVVLVMQSTGKVYQSTETPEPVQVHAS